MCHMGSSTSTSSAEYRSNMGMAAAIFLRSAAANKDGTNAKRGAQAECGSSVGRATAAIMRSAKNVMETERTRLAIRRCAAPPPSKQVGTPAGWLPTCQVVPAAHTQVGGAWAGPVAPRCCSLLSSWDTGRAGIQNSLTTCGAMLHSPCFPFGCAADACSSQHSSPLACQPLHANRTQTHLHCPALLLRHLPLLLRRQLLRYERRPGSGVIKRVREGGLARGGAGESVQILLSVCCCCCACGAYTQGVVDKLGAARGRGVHAGRCGQIRRRTRGRQRPYANQNRRMPTAAQAPPSLRSHATPAAYAPSATAPRWFRLRAAASLRSWLRRPE